MGRIAGCCEICRLVRQWSLSMCLDVCRLPKTGNIHSNVYNIANSHPLTQYRLEISRPPPSLPCHEEDSIGQLSGSQSASVVPRNLSYAEFRVIRGVRKFKYCVAESESGVNRFLSMRQTHIRFQVVRYIMAPRRPDNGWMPLY